MLKFHRLGLVILLVTLVATTSSDSAFAQRRGKGKSGGRSNNNTINSAINNNQSGTRRNRKKDNQQNSNVQQFQNLLQGSGQGHVGQNNSGNAQQFRRNNQQSNKGLQQTFKNSQQFQQFIGGNQGQGNKNFNNWQSQKFNRRNELQQWVVGFHGGPRPFSNDWYKNHPNAWHYHHSYNNWEYATAAGVVGWLGWQAVRPYNNTVYVYDPVPVQTVIVNGQPTVTVDPGQPGDWMTLGSYSLMTGAGEPGTRILQLSIDRTGNIRGTYYDMISNVTSNVVGLIDKNTQQVRWTLDTNRDLTFVATLDQLTQPQGVVNVKLPGGQIQQWQLVRMEDSTEQTEDY